MRIYISGPMTGLQDLNFPTFRSNAAKLRGAGYTVVNPAELCTDPNQRWEDCLRKDLAELVACDGVAMLPGWEASRGARLERYIALELGMVVGDVRAFLLMQGQRPQPASEPDLAEGAL
ncbi:DUF4406 domain-containing protein [Allopusillimonas soli]|uniref:DUF4406 domain-containing protein n=1 Tax=Allopusillimonas soli TaxID=659016 RepID=A0A853FGX5_9BURK|nr:DUF4406 domain-containing protein [Allopusillimonas soli]NYT38892.1 DUF4406 domain-containing protein [Allopusillimonas soli]TEA70109.1 DUF4406 domain-containing protein [Allopusillimonas soli]